MFRSLCLTLLAFHAVLASKFVYVFDQDAKGASCDTAQESTSEEDFRLFCINQQSSFRECALTCSQALHFEGSTGLCKSHRCNFYGFHFPEGNTGKSLSMSNIAQDKVTLFAVTPLWEGHAQYMYEMLEAIRSMYKDQTEAIVLPIDIHDYSLSHPRFELKPFEGDNKKVHILEEVKPSKIAAHPFLIFLRSLVHKSGFPTFDVYTERPVVFVVSSDGYIVERMVVPTIEELSEAVRKYSKIETSKAMWMIATSITKNK